MARVHIPASKSLHIAGNRLSFSPAGNVLGFAHAPVHIFNKNGQYCEYPGNEQVIDNVDANSNPVVQNDADEDNNNANNSNTPITHSSVARVMRGRMNAIVMGDSVGDADICKDKDGRVVLRIGFLHVKEKKGDSEEAKSGETVPASPASYTATTPASEYYTARELDHIAKYCDKFDIVMVGEDSMGVGGAVVEAVAGGKVSAFGKYTVENYQGSGECITGEGECVDGEGVDGACVDGEGVSGGEECVLVGDVDKFVEQVLRSVRQWE